jgi:hypothetical protein
MASERKMGIQRLSQRPFGDASRVSLLVPEYDNLRDAFQVLAITCLKSNHTLLKIQNLASYNTYLDT